MTIDARLLEGLPVLVAISERGSFSRAAQVLGLTTSGVSRAIGRLELRLGVRLFQRTPRGAELTEEARRLCAEVAPLLGNLTEAAQRASRSSAAVRGRLRVSTDLPFGSRLGARLVALRARYPELEVELSVHMRFAEAEAAGFDVCVRYGPPERSSLTCRKLFETRVLTCAAPSYVATHGRPEHPRDLAQHECINVLDPVTGRPFLWELQRGDERVEVEARGRVLIDNPVVAMSACLSGYGIAQPLEANVVEYLARGELVQLLPEWADERWPAYAYYRGRTAPNARVRAFLDFIVEITRDQTSSAPPSTVTTLPEAKPLRSRKR